MDDRRGDYSSLPIPTYEEAISARPSSSQNYRGPQEISDDAERQGLLRGQPPSGYRAPTVESPRSSTDTDLGLPEMTDERVEASRRQIEELDYLDPAADEGGGARSSGRRYHRTRTRSNFTKRLANLSATFSSLRLPSFRSLYSSVPHNDPTSDNNDPNNNSETPPRRPPWWTRPSRFSIPEHYRMSAPTFARLCGLFTIAMMIYVLFAFDIFPGHDRRFGRQIDAEAVRSFVQQNIKAADIAKHLRYITSYDHVAGTEGDLFLARWMEEQWMNNGGFDEVAILEYFGYLNYPTRDGRSVRITAPEDKRWTAKLEEDVVDPDKKQTLAWHGHSKSGVAKGPLIYANGGSRQDFAWLRQNGVDTNGTIALIREDAKQGNRGMKIKAAEEVGCVGVLMYTDPTDDGAARGAVWPEGRWRPDDSVQRGDVGLSNWIIGDPLTPGWPSTKGAQRGDKERSKGLAQIPSLPLAWRDAKVLIDALRGHGVEVPAQWVGDGKTGHKWFSGTGARPVQEEALPEVSLKNLNDEDDHQRIWNVHGLVTGIEQSAEKVIIGNHRDAWCFGAVDPGSGSAIMMHIIAIFGALRQIGWRPLRTIEFVSWDAKEFNLMGSTEYVEDKINYLRDHGVAYLNVGAGVFGPNFRAAGSPVWLRPLLHVLNRVADPSNNGSLKETWDHGKQWLQALGGDGDYVAFQDMAGTSSIDMGFESREATYPRDSCYETFEWMEKFGDPDFSHHHALAQVWALLILELADRPIIPYDLTAYSAVIRIWVAQLERDAQALLTARATSSSDSSTDPLPRAPAHLDFKALHAAANRLAEQTAHFHRFEDMWTASVMSMGGLEGMDFALQRLDYNKRIARFETDLLDLPHSGDGNSGAGDADHFVHHGLWGREQFRHLLFSPVRWDEFEQPFFPAIRDALARRNWEDARRQIGNAAAILKRAGDQLVEGVRW